MGLLDRVKRVVKPVARRVVFGTAVHPTGAARLLYRAVFDADYLVREAYEWARRSMVATPTLVQEGIELTHIS